MAISLKEKILIGDNQTEIQPSKPVIIDEGLIQLKGEFAIWLETSSVALERLMKAPGGHLSEQQKNEVVCLQNQFHLFSKMVEKLTSAPSLDDSNIILETKDPRDAGHS